MSSVASVQDLNRQLAHRINQEARSNPASPYANKFVGIANGQVVVVTDDLDDLAQRLRQVEPDPARTFGIEASRNYDEIHDIWEANWWGCDKDKDLSIQPGPAPCRPRI